MRDNENNRNKYVTREGFFALSFLDDDDASLEFERERERSLVFHFIRFLDTNTTGTRHFISFFFVLMGAEEARD